jgi:hypothetical protein
VSEWISVSERLPEVAVGGIVRVLVSDGRYVIPAEFYLKSIDWWNEKRTYAWRASSTMSSEWQLWDSITHWQPFPAPPEAQ